MRVVSLFQDRHARQNWIESVPPQVPEVQVINMNRSFHVV